MQGPAGPTGSDGLIGPQGYQGLIGPTGTNGTIGVDGATGPQGFQGLIGTTGSAGVQGFQGPAGSGGGSGASVSLGSIEVYFQGSSYLSKVIVSSNIATTGTFTFAGPTNTTITITGLATSFTYPYSVVSWGRDFTSSSNPTKSRIVGLFNQTACRLDYDTTGSGTLTFTNATTTNLGCAAVTNLPAGPTETLVARVYMALQ